jgi:serine/threonine-protein kinase
MAPEQLGGDPIDARADLYALATIAFRALTGRPPFLGRMEVVLFHVLRTPAPPVTRFNPFLPADLDAVFTIALAKSRDDRFSTGAELKNRARELFEALPTESPVAADPLTDGTTRIFG